MWSPTHVHVVVKRAENLLVKGKNGTNNSFVVIELGKETYRTSVKENSKDSVIWNEECELKIPKAGNTAAINLTAYHRNSLGLDQFLGTVKIPLISFDKYQKIVQWYRLQGKPGKERGKNKLRGELEVQIAFTAQSQSQSLTSLQSKRKMSFEKLTGSLFTLRNNKKSFDVRKLRNTSGRDLLKKNLKGLESMEELDERDKSNTFNNSSATNSCNNLDPGVISDEEDSGSHKSFESLGRSRSKISSNNSFRTERTFLKNPEISISQWEDNTSQLISSLNVSQGNISSKPKLEDLRNRLADRRLSISCVDLTHFLSPKPEKKFLSSTQLEDSQGESPKKLSKFTKKLRNFHFVDKKEVKKPTSSIDYEALLGEETVPKSEFKNKNKEELINMVVDLQKRVNCVSVRVKDLEDYLDDILLKVMETVPTILEKS